MTRNTVTLAVLCIVIAQVAGQKDIIETALDLGCNQFVQWLNFSSDFITDQLVSDADSYTLFAVTDTDMPDGIERLFSIMGPGLLARYISYSFVNGSYKAADFENEKLIDSATLPPFTVRKLRMNTYTKQNGDPLVTIHGRPVISTDHQATNGVVHLIDGFLIYETETIGDRLLTSYKQLTKALTTVELLDVFLGDTPYTVFAPSDAAFFDLLETKNNDTRILDYKHPLTGILRGHVVSGTYFSDIMETGLELETIGYGRKLTVEVLGDGTIMINGVARVVQQRIMKNGVIFEIDTVLTIPTDLTEDTMMDVAQDLGCDWMLHYLYRGEQYDQLRGDVNGPNAATFFALEEVGFTDRVRFRLDSALPVLLGNYLKLFTAIGEIKVSDFTNDRLVPSSDGVRNLRLNVYGDEFNRKYTVNGRPINLMDRQASNGIVHTIQTFMTSESWTDVGRFIEIDPNLAELETRLGWFGLLNVLKGPGPYTAFTPENPAFDGFNLSNDTLEDILKAHVVDGTYYTDGLENDLALITLNQQVIKVTVNPDTGVKTLNGDVTVLQERVVGNGVVHIVDKLLFGDGNLPGTTTLAPGTTTTAGAGVSHLHSFLLLLLLVSAAFYKLL